MEPWYRNWTGRSERLDANHFILSGNPQKTAEGLLKITELPPKRWPRDFKKVLEGHISEATSAIKSFTQIASPNGINFEITLKDKQMDVATQRSLEEELGLHHIMTTKNLIALDADGQTQQYHTELDMLEEFYLLRFQAYQTRKQHLLKTIQKELTQWTDQFRFANMILDGELDISQEETSLAEQLHQRGFASIKDHNDGNTTTKKRKRNASEVDIALAGYDHLFKTTVSSMTRKALNELESQIASKRVKMDKIQETTIQEMWEADLREFLVEWDTQLQKPPVQEGCYLSYTLVYPKHTSHQQELLLQSQLIHISHQKKHHSSSKLTIQKLLNRNFTSPSPFPPQTHFVPFFVKYPISTADEDRNL
ncbi:type II DNA topoisomerase [Aureobasidium pullulans]|uniref:DNA topoisomerase (ATP-hydrolyzing) n=1 Tax=Aureobasidium pullulans TaxID=5580 RepID=A0AB74JQI7_AURPU|nr:type II DNA topoisomerase [Aureobasidium pullulans]